MKCTCRASSLLMRDTRNICSVSDIILLEMQVQSSAVRWNAAQYNMILHTLLQELRLNINQWLNSQNTPCLALSGDLWDVSCEYFADNEPCYNDTALYSTHKESCLWFVHLCLTPAGFTHTFLIFLEVSTGTEAIVSIPQCQWRNPRWYG